MRHARLPRGGEPRPPAARMNSRTQRCGFYGLAFNPCAHMRVAFHNRNKGPLMARKALRVRPFRRENERDCLPLASPAPRRTNEMAHDPLLRAATNPNLSNQRDPGNPMLCLFNSMLRFSLAAFSSHPPSFQLHNMTPRQFYPLSVWRKGATPAQQQLRLPQSGGILRQDNYDYDCYD